SVDVKDKNPVVFKMQCNASKYFSPIREAEQVIDRVEYANDRVKASCDTEAGHILPEKAYVRKLLPGDREHRTRTIQSGDVIGRREKSYDRAGTTGDFKYRRRVGLVMRYQAGYVSRRIRAVAHDHVVK